MGTDQRERIFIVSQEMVQIIHCLQVENLIHLWHIVYAARAVGPKTR